MRDRCPDCRRNLARKTYRGYCRRCYYARQRAVLGSATSTASGRNWWRPAAADRQREEADHGVD